MGNFFTCEYQILKQGLDIGFHLYAPGHLIWLAAIAAAAFLFSASYRIKDKNERARARKIFAALILLSEIYKDTVLIIMGAPMMQYLPLHLCSFAIFGMLIDAFAPKQQLMGQMFAFAFFPGALAALLFGFFRALGNVYTGFSFLKALNLPSSLYNMLPYIISLIVLAFTSKNSRAPKAEGIPYDKGMR